MQLRRTIRNMHRTLSLLLLIVALFLASAPVVAQQQFRLAEDDEWHAEREVDPGSPEGQLAEARRALAEDDPRRAENLTTRWIEQHTRHPLLPEAYLIRGDAKMAQRNFYKALFDYEYVARVYPGSEAFVTALEREYEIAEMFAYGMKRKLWGMRIVNASEEAQEILIRIQERIPGSRLAEKAGMELADFYFRRGQMSLAAEAYDLFVENYPRSEHVSKARRRLIYANLASYKGPEFDAAGLIEARFRLQELKQEEPATAEEIGADALLSGIREAEAQKLLENARWYWRKKNVIATEFTIRRLVKRYPNTAAARDALRFVPRVLRQLPEQVKEQAPDYESLRAGLLGGDDSGDSSDDSLVHGGQDESGEVH